ncbi:hypothetical protein LINGRAHAP2_LOCUS29369 [Linum grandiflorum]
MMKIKFNNKCGQILMLLIMATLLMVAPLIPSSLRPKYLYFIFNLLIIALAAEAGLLPTPSNSNNIKLSSSVSPASKPLEAATSKKVVEKFPSEEVSRPTSTEKSCPASSDMPSLFFIGEEDFGKDEEEENDDDDDLVGEINEQEELFTKAETFIGNFYNQLKMQRDMGFMAKDTIHRQPMVMA